MTVLRHGNKLQTSFTGVKTLADLPDTAVKWRRFDNIPFEAKL